MKVSIVILGNEPSPAYIEDFVIAANHWWERILLRLHLLRFDQKIIEYRGARTFRIQVLDDIHVTLKPPEAANG